MHYNVTCSEKLALLIKEKNISPSQAFKVGVHQLLEQPFVPEPDSTLYESEVAKRQRIQNTMQEAMNIINEQKEASIKEIEELKKKEERLKSLCSITLILWQKKSEK